MGREEKTKKVELFDYFKIKDKKSPHYQRIHSKIIKNIDALIKARLIFCFGWRTQKEWPCREISLTAQGRKRAQKLFAKQKLPL